MVRREGATAGPGSRCVCRPGPLPTCGPPPPARRPPPGSGRAAFPHPAPREDDPMGFRGRAAAAPPIHDPLPKGRAAVGGFPSPPPRPPVHPPSLATTVSPRPAGGGRRVFGVQDVLERWPRASCSASGTKPASRLPGQSSASCTPAAWTASACSRAGSGAPSFAALRGGAVRSPSSTSRRPPMRSRSCGVCARTARRARSPWSARASGPPSRAIHRPPSLHVEEPAAARSHRSGRSRHAQPHPQGWRPPGRRLAVLIPRVPLYGRRPGGSRYGVRREPDELHCPARGRAAPRDGRRGRTPALARSSLPTPVPGASAWGGA